MYYFVKGDFLNYENLLEEATCDNIYVVENADFKSKADGLINGDVIGISRKIRSTRKRTCILAEELGHYHTSTGNILNQSTTANRKQEYRARLWAYNKLIGLNGIVSAYQAGCQNIHDMAAHLDVTTDFLQEALSCYRNKYGVYARIDNYVIYFEPTIGVFELI